MNKLKKLLLTSFLISSSLMTVGCNIQETSSSEQSSSSSSEETPVEIVEPHEGPLVEFNTPTEYGALDVSPVDQYGSFEAFEITREELPDEVTVLKPLKVEQFEKLDGKEIFVSTLGSDSNEGTIDSPLRTIEAGMAKLENQNGGVLYLRGGRYSLTDTLKFNELHSGTSDTPTYISSYNGEEVTITSGLDITREKFSSIDEMIKKGLVSKSVYSKLSDDAIKNVLVADLYSLGMKYGEFAPFTRTSKPTLMVNNKSETVARYPNDDEDQVVVGKVNKVGQVTRSSSDLYGKHKDDIGGFNFQLTDSYPFTWTKTDDLWIYGAVSHEWRRENFNVELDEINGTISTFMSSEYGAMEKSNNTFYFFNALEAIDIPGEFYVDSKDGLLYYYPSEDFEYITYATEAFNLLEVTNAKNMIFNDIEFTGSVKNALALDSTEQVIVQNCNIHHNGGDGMSIKAAKTSGAIYCDFSANSGPQFREYYLQNFERSTLEPKNNFLQNCTFQDPVIGTEDEGASVGGVGFICSHNYFKDTRLIVTKSNESIFEYNELEGASGYTEDGGAIYVNGGYNLSSRGNHIRYNYIHDLKKSHAGIYLDDFNSGNFVYGNIVDANNPEIGVFGGKLTYRLHGGRENVLWNNISIGGTKSAFADKATHLTDSSHDFDKSFAATIDDAKYGYADESYDFTKSEAFKNRYPSYIEYMEKLVDYVENGNEDNYRWLIEPLYNTFGNNLIIDAGIALDLSYECRKSGYYLDTNLEIERSVLDENYQIVDESIYDEMPDFVDVPFEKMGLTR